MEKRPAWAIVALMTGILMVCGSTACLWVSPWVLAVIHQ